MQHKLIQLIEWYLRPATGYSDKLPKTKCCTRHPSFTANACATELLVFCNGPNADVKETLAALHRMIVIWGGLSPCSLNETKDKPGFHDRLRMPTVVSNSGKELIYLIMHLKIRF